MPGMSSNSVYVLVDVSTTFDSFQYLRHKTPPFFFMVSKTPHSFLLLHELLFFSLLCFTIFFCFAASYQKAPRTETRSFLFTMHQSMDHLRERSLEKGSFHSPDNENQYCLKVSATMSLMWLH